MKKFNEKIFASEIKKFNKILIYDESTYSGGISPIITNFLSKNKILIEIEFLVCPNIQLFRYSNEREKIIEKIGLSKKYLIKKLNEIT